MAREQQYKNDLEFLKKNLGSSAKLLLIEELAEYMSYSDLYRSQIMEDPLEVYKRFADLFGVSSNPDITDEKLKSEMSKYKDLWVVRDEHGLGVSRINKI